MAIRNMLSTFLAVTFEAWAWVPHATPTTFRIEKRLLRKNAVTLTMSWVSIVRAG
jgi:hypothetical protein